MITLAECYELAGGNYQDALTRLMSEKIAGKFVRKYPADGSYAELKDAMAAGDLDTAFRAAHTMKGVAYNLSFTRLGDAASDLTEALRPGHEDQRTEENLQALRTVVDEAQATTLAAIARLDD